MKTDFTFKEVDRSAVFEDAPKSDEVEHIIACFLSTGYDIAELRNDNGDWAGVSMTTRITRYAEKHGFPVKAKTRGYRSYIMKREVPE